MSGSKIPDKNKYEFTVAEIFFTLVRRKWWLIAVFFLILASGFVFSFLRVPQYSVNTALSLTNNYIFYNDLIYKYFPEESEDLWIFPGDKNYALEPRVLYRIQKTIESGEFLKELSSDIDGRLSKDELAKRLRFSVSEDEMYLKIDIVCPGPDLALKTLNSITDRTKEEKSSELDIKRLDLIEKLDAKTEELKIEMDRLIESGEQKKDYLASQELDNLASDYFSLEKVKESLTQSSTLFTERIEVIDNPDLSDVVQITYLKRDLIVSFFAAVVIGIIAAFIADFFIILKENLRKKRIDKR